MRNVKIIIALFFISIALYSQETKYYRHWEQRIDYQNILEENSRIHCNRKLSVIELILMLTPDQ